MIVTRKDFKAAILKLKQTGEYGLDTETTGLRLSDRLFSLIIADDRDGYYFNFNDNPDHLGNSAPKELTLPREWLAEFQQVFDNPASLWYIHNAKFDIGMVAKEGVSILGTVHCTEVVERVLKNNYIGNKPYSLKSVAPRYGFEKDEAVDTYIEQHKLFTLVDVPGKDKPKKDKHFDLVPYEIMAKYGINDAVIHRAIGVKQRATIAAQDATRPGNQPPIRPLIENEYQLTKVCERIERTGIKIDRAYVEKALAFTEGEARREMGEFERMVGLEYSDSAAQLSTAFGKYGIELPKTRTGKPCTNKQVLDALENPLAEKIRAIRSHQKLASTYYSSFLYFADTSDLIHANMRQGGTETLRFSYSDPNLQNLPKEDDEEDERKAFIVRRSFVPLNPEWIFYAIDFKQQEYRMMADYANERELIAAIMAGEDVHDATARLMGLVERYGAKKARKMAKNLNFGLLYGMGAEKLAKSLGVPLAQAQELRAIYFQKLPNVRKFIKQVMFNGESRGYIFNWMGFRSHISDPAFAYVLPNHIIQGGCAQVCRVAMVRLDDYIRANRLKTRMILQVHDEILFQVRRGEEHHVAAFQKIMESVYPGRNGIKLDCSVSYSTKSFAKWDMIEGMPGGKAA